MSNPWVETVDAVDASGLASSSYGLLECLPWIDAANARRSAKARDAAPIPVSMLSILDRKG